MSTKGPDRIWIGEYKLSQRKLITSNSFVEQQPAKKKRRPPKIAVVYVSNANLRMDVDISNCIRVPIGLSYPSESKFFVLQDFVDIPKDKIGVLLHCKRDLTVDFFHT
ncbi:hypothetical protein ACA910_012657 [Epithemia clementina (nom. ined.)]